MWKLSNFCGLMANQKMMIHSVITFVKKICNLFRDKEPNVDWKFLCLSCLAYLDDMMQRCQLQLNQTQLSIIRGQKIAIWQNTEEHLFTYAGPVTSFVRSFICS